MIEWDVNTHFLEKDLTRYGMSDEERVELLLECWRLEGNPIIEVMES